MSVYGFDLLKQQAVERLLSEFDLNRQIWWPGDSEIERLLVMSLTYACRLGHSFEPRFISVEKYEGLQPSTGESLSALLIEHQVQLEGWRVDFLIHTFGTEAASSNEGGWQSLIVECDGHNFHERTKEQAAKDRSRDRAFQMKGYEVFRFTGSELWRDPIGCADQIIRWAERKQGQP